MNPNKALWEKGDFTRISATMRDSGEAFVNTLGITKGLKVLDLGCGDGTTALPEARLGADVLGVDIATNLVEAGNRRAREAGLANCRFANYLELPVQRCRDLINLGGVPTFTMPGSTTRCARKSSLNATWQKYEQAAQPRAVAG